MSICIWAVPVALALRVLMGEKQFKEWIESNTERMPTNFKDREDLVRTVKAAGFDAEEWGSAFKTHIDDKFWFMWSFYQNLWQAEFTKSDDRQKIKQFVHTLQQSAHRQIFCVDAAVNKVKVVTEQSLPTIYTDKNLLVQTLKKHGVQHLQVMETDIRCELNGISLQFVSKAVGQAYEIWFTDKRNLQMLYQEIRNLDEEYCGCVQEHVYKSVKEKLQEKNLTIESEEILEDNSILLTVTI